MFPLIVSLNVWHLKHVRQLHVNGLTHMHTHTQACTAFFFVRYVHVKNIFKIIISLASHLSSQGLRVLPLASPRLSAVLWWVISHVLTLPLCLSKAQGFWDRLSFWINWNTFRFISGLTESWAHSSAWKPLLGLIALECCLRGWLTISTVNGSVCLWLSLVMSPPFGANDLLGSVLKGIIEFFWLTLFDSTVDPRTFDGSLCWESMKSYIGCVNFGFGKLMAAREMCMSDYTCNKL